MSRYITLLIFLCIDVVAVAQEPKLILPIGHLQSVNSAVFSKDGRKALTASQDNTAKIWDTYSGNLLVDFKGHSGWIQDASFSPDEKNIVTASWDSTCKVWDAISGKLIATYTDAHDYVNKARFTPDGKRVIMQCYSGKVKSWDLTTGKTVFEVEGLGQYEDNFFVVSKDGSMFASVNPASVVTVRDMQTGSKLATFTHTGKISWIDFSGDGKQILSVTDSDTAFIWDIRQKTKLHQFTGEYAYFGEAVLSPDGKKLLSSSSGQIVEVWDIPGKKITATISFLEDGKNTWVSSASFSADGKTLMISTNHGDLQLRNLENGKLIKEFKMHTEKVRVFSFSKDEKLLLTLPEYSAPKIWQANSFKLIAELKGHSSYVSVANFSPDGKKMATTYGYENAKVWDFQTGKLLNSFAHPESSIHHLDFNANGSRLLIGGSSHARLWDVDNGQLISDFKEHTGSINSSFFSSDGKRVVTTDDTTIKIWDSFSGQLLSSRIPGKKIESAQFSPDGAKLINIFEDNTIEIFDIAAGKTMAMLKYHSDYIHTAQFSPDGKRFVVASNDHSATVWDLSSGQLLTSLTGYTNRVLYAEFSPDGTKIVTTGLDGAVIWDANTGTKIYSIPSSQELFRAYFIDDGKKIVTDDDHFVQVWDVSTGKHLYNLDDSGAIAYSADVTLANNHILTSHSSGLCKVWDSNGELKYSFVGIDSSDYLVMDKNDHYDGSETARKKLYFTCGKEVIGLDQVKDLLWVPNLADRIMKGETIQAKTLKDLSICGLTPEIESKGYNNQSYQFNIFPRRGGLGETVLQVNGIEVKRFSAGQLQKRGDHYELTVPIATIENNLIAGKENPVTITAYTADNSISSRGIITSADKTNEAVVTPNLYAVMVGVSDYKGDELDLKYAAKDAEDLSLALGAASRRLLNRDGKEHVFLYNLTTSANRYLLPEKQSIHNTLLEIGKKATANDIILIFFAGHGVMQTKAGNKQFYFLTADASKSSAIDATADVGISTKELTEWIKPSVVKAQKRIMIFDACNSGQAIRDFVKLGQPDQGYVVARSDDQGQLIKAIERLNNQSGLFMLAASASDQNAYEMSRYSQGLLTYALLKAIKLQPDILENGELLDVSNWLNAAKKTVTNLMSETGARQEPQLNASNNFNIGLVDEDVRRQIILSSQKPIFTRSNFQNVSLRIDDLKLRNSVDRALQQMASSATEAPITYSAEYDGADAYLLNGEYQLSGNSIKVSVLITKGAKEIVYKFEVTGMATDISALSHSIITTALDWMQKHQ